MKKDLTQRLESWCYTLQHLKGFVAMTMNLGEFVSWVIKSQMKTTKLLHFYF